MPKEPKFTTTEPTNDQANFLLFSMHGIDGINAYLKNFPQYNPSAPPKAVSATLLWSGQAGYNVNVVTFGDGRIYTGFVLDPNNIEVPQADTRAYKSNGRIETEVKKTAYRGQYDEACKKSKHPEKQGYDRVRGFETNLARFVRNDNPKESTYSAVGSGDILSLNIWHKYFKTKEPEKQHDPKIVKHPMDLNEALVFQKGAVNPIAGLFLTGKPDRDTADKLKKILKDRPSLKLYLYDIQENKHILPFRTLTQRIFN